MNQNNPNNKKEFEITDEMIKEAGIELMKKKRGTEVANPVAVKKLARVHELCKLMTKGSKVKISCHAFEPDISMGYVSIIGAEINVSEPRSFAEAYELSQTFEIYARTDGNLEMSFTIHDMTLS